MSVRLDNVGALIIKSAKWDSEFAIAVMRAVRLDATAAVETVKVTEVAPAGTETDAGTDAAASLLERVTGNPPAGAGLEMTIVAVDDAPPASDVGFSVIELRIGARTMSDALTVVPLRVAVTEFVVSEATLSVIAVNVTEDAPAATVTDAGK